MVQTRAVRFHVLTEAVHSVQRKPFFFITALYISIHLTLISRNLSPERGCGPEGVTNIMYGKAVSVDKSSRTASRDKPYRTVPHHTTPHHAPSKLVSSATVEKVAYETPSDASTIWKISRDTFRPKKPRRAFFFCVWFPLLVL